MKIAYVTNFEAKSLAIRDNWSGTGYYIAQSLKNQDITVEYMGPLQDPVTLQTIRKLKSRYYKLFYKKNYQKDADPLTLKNYASQVAKKLNSIKSDIVFSATVNPIAYLECEQPIVFWADGTFANIQDFYSVYSNLPKDVIYDWHRMEELALQKCKLAIYSSDWAAKSAIYDYGADPAKVKVVPFGANVESSFTFETIKDVINSRPTDQCKLLFLAVDWMRKGGNIAYQVAEKLNQAGLKTELTIVGCQPMIDAPLPDFVKSLGFISKSTVEGKKQIQNLILQSHFLILPTLADCTPIVFCEANSLGVPCLSTTVGGVPTMIHNDVNGQLFSKDVDITNYSQYIQRLFDNYADYKQLALSAFNEYQTRLNWTISGQTVKKLLLDIISYK
jgi:glycosyltransferase involved in cell wall biosynthesis